MSSSHKIQWNVLLAQKETHSSERSEFEKEKLKSAFLEYTAGILWETLSFIHCIGLYPTLYNKQDPKSRLLKF